MKQGMDNHPVQFLFVSSMVFLGIGPHRVQTDKHVARQDFPLDIVKGNHVGVVIVIQIFSVHIQDIGVTAKNKRNSSNLTGIVACDNPEPLPYFLFRKKYALLLW